MPQPDGYAMTFSYQGDIMVIAIIIGVLLIAALIVLYATYYKTFYYPIKNISETRGPITKTRHPYRDEASVNLSRRDPMITSISARGIIRATTISRCSSASTAITAPLCAIIRAWGFG